MKKAIAIILLLVAILPRCAVRAEDNTIYVLCDPKSHVNVRESPSTGSAETGRLECGDSVLTDGRTRNGFVHVFGITEYGEGWVYAGYVVDDAPVVEKCYGSVAASGRVMTRNCIGGRRLYWLSVCSDVVIYALSEEWAVTNRGYVRTEYLEVWHE